MKDFITSSEAFQEYLKELALDEFPTGDGNWVRYRCFSVFEEMTIYQIS